MKEIISTITSKGQITIPAEVRKHLRVGHGDKLSFVITDSGRVEMTVPRYPTVASLRERSAGLDQEMSYDEMKEIAYSNLDFGDAMLVAEAQERGAQLIYSYDRDFDRIHGVTRLEP